MKDHSIYCSAFNLIKMGFDWSATLDNWSRFLGEEGQIVIAVNTSEDETYQRLLEYAMFLNNLKQGEGLEWTIFKTDIPYSDPLFDGKIKNEALKRCNREYCTLLDMDEVLPLSNRSAWDMAKNTLCQNPGFDAMYVPVIDLFQDESHYKALGSKWYLHPNHPYLRRGRVAFAARADGSTDITKSDTCELIHDNGRLAYAARLMGMGGTNEDLLRNMRLNRIPYVVHLGWLNKQQRLRQSAFWAPVWCARAGDATVEKPLTESDLDKVPYWPHNLPHWNHEA